MTNVIEFLEKMGQDAQLRHAPAAELNTAMSSMSVDTAIQTAILNKDQEALESLLGANTNVCCMIEAIDMNDHEPIDRENLQSVRVNRVATAV